MNARLFPAHWRPALEEVAFASASGFAAMQFPGPAGGLGHERLGAPVAAVADALEAAGIEPVQEVLVFVGADGTTADGETPLDVLRANLEPARRLGVRRAHLHLALADWSLDDASVHRLERSLEPTLREAVAIAADAGMCLGIEHNQPALRLLADPHRLADLLDAVPGLGLVWDLNHTPPDRLELFTPLAPRMLLLHVSDTQLPLVNGHLPLGRGSLDLALYLGAAVRAGFTGPAVLEVGGHPASGGFGQDSDAALRDSLARLRVLVAALGEPSPERGA